MISLTSGLSLKLYLNSLVCHRNIFESSSKVFGNLRQSSDIFGKFRKFSENVRERSSAIRDNLENLRKSSENHQKRRYQYVYIINRIIHGRLEICEHSKINSISPRAHALFSMYTLPKAISLLINEFIQ